MKFLNLLIYPIGIIFVISLILVISTQGFTVDAVTLKNSFSNRQTPLLSVSTLPVLQDTSEIIIPPTFYYTPEFPTFATKQEIGYRIGSDYLDRTGYYFHDLKRGITLEHNSNQLFPPGSITKLPYALLVMNDIQAGKISLNSTLPINQSLKAYEYDLLYSYPPGYNLTIETYLRKLISSSDSTAMMHIEYYLGGYQKVQNRIRQELGIEVFSRDPNQGSPYSTYQLLNMIYSPNQYLNDESRDFLLDTLLDSDIIFHTRIRGGLPDEVVVGNKIGNLVTLNGVAINDSAIIYGQKSDYIFVVLTEDYPTMEMAEYMIQDITRIAFQSLESWE